MTSSNDTSDERPVTSTNWGTPTRLVVSLVTLAVAGTAIGLASAHNRINIGDDSATAWLPSIAAGYLDRANALLPAPMIGSTDHIRLTIHPDVPPARGNGFMILTDRSARRAVLLDLRTQQARPVALGPHDTVVVAGARALLVDAATGRVDRLAADGAVVATPVAHTAGRPGGWAVAAGVLWLAEPATGALLRVGDAGPATRIEQAFTPGHDPLLAGAGDTAALLDPEAGVVRLVSGPAGGEYPLRLPAGRPDSFAVAPGGDYAAVVSGSTRVTIAGLADHAEPVTRSVGAAGDSFGAPVLLHDRVYLGDARTGEVWSARARPVVGEPSSIAVGAGPTDVELFVNGTAVWANDPNGPNALAIYDDSRQPIKKYAPPSPTPHSPDPPPSTSPSVSHSPTTRTAGPTTHITKTTVTRNPTTGPPATTGPPGHANKASFTNIGNNAKVGRCRTLAGRSDIDGNKTLMIAQRRTDPPDGVYYVWYAGPTTGGLAPGPWTSRNRIYFGTETGQRYSVYLMIIDVPTAQAYWNGHVSADGSYAHSTSLPAPAADTVTGVEQTSMTC